MDQRSAVRSDESTAPDGCPFQHTARSEPEALIEDHPRMSFSADIPVKDDDPYDPAVLAEPHADWARLREVGPLVHLSRYNVLACGRYDEVKAVFGDHERFSSAHGVGVSDLKAGTPWRKPSLLLEVDPPDHDRTRRVMTRALSPKVIRDLSETLTERAEALLAPLLDGTAVEGVSALAEVYPTTVFPEVIGLGTTDRERLLAYGSMVFNANGPNNGLRRDALSQAKELTDWVGSCCKRDRIRSDGLAASLYAAVDAEDVNEDEADLLVRSLLSAGLDTTASALSSTLWCLAQSPDALARIQAEPKLARPAFEEVLRFVSPVHTFFRTARMDTEIAGYPVPAGAKIACGLGAANHDPEAWDRADIFDVVRKPVGHLAFGTGVHTCVGQNLARAEIQAMLSVLAQRVSHIELLDTPRWQPNNSMRQLATLPIRFHA